MGTLGHGASGEAQSSDICQQNGGGGLISHPGPGCLFRGKINRSMPFHFQAVYKVCRLDQSMFLFPVRKTLTRQLFSTFTRIFSTSISVMKGSCSSKFIPYPRPRLLLFLKRGKEIQRFLCFSRF